MTGRALTLGTDVPASPSGALGVARRVAARPSRPVAPVRVPPPGAGPPVPVQRAGIRPGMAPGRTAATRAKADRDRIAAVQPGTETAARPGAAGAASAARLLACTSTGRSASAGRSAPARRVPAVVLPPGAALRPGAARRRTAPRRPGAVCPPGMARQPTAARQPSAARARLETAGRPLEVHPTSAHVELAHVELARVELAHAAPVHGIQKALVTFAGTSRDPGTARTPDRHGTLRAAPPGAARPRPRKAGRWAIDQIVLAAHARIEPTAPQHPGRRTAAGSGQRVTAGRLAAARQARVRIVRHEAPPGRRRKPAMTGAVTGQARRAPDPVAKAAVHGARQGKVSAAPGRTVRVTAAPGPTVRATVRVVRSGMATRVPAGMAGPGPGVRSGTATRVPAGMAGPGPGVRSGTATRVPAGMAGPGPGVRSGMATRVPAGMAGPGPADRSAMATAGPGRRKTASAMVPSCRLCRPASPLTNSIPRLVPS